MFKPELINSLKGYSIKKFLSDLSAGIIVGIVALPLAIAFGIASGAGPSEGIFTAIIAGFLISALGGSKVQIGGPTGAFIVIVYSVIQKYGISGLATATIIAGILLILLGVFKLGSIVKFIPYTIITGFTAGIAVVIATGQIGDFFGLTTEKLPGEFIEKMAVYAHSFNTINFWSFGLASISLTVLFIWPKINRRIPASLIVILTATIISTIFDFASKGVATIGSRYTIPQMLPIPVLPNLNLSAITELFPTAVSIAILAAVESLLSAVVADGMIASKHNSDQELIAQGIANIVSPIFGGIPATGAIARTATNIKNGGRTPIAGMIHALTLLLILMFFGKLVNFIPMPVLSAILINVSWNMAGFKEIKKLLKGQKSDIAVLFTAFLLTVFIDLTIAIGTGLILAAFFFIQKITSISNTNKYSGNSKKTDTYLLDSENLEVPEGVLIYEIDGPLFFGTVRKFEAAVEFAGAKINYIIIRMGKSGYLDAGGMLALEELHKTCQLQNVKLMLCEIKNQPLKLLSKSEFFSDKENLYTDINSVLKTCKA